MKVCLSKVDIAKRQLETAIRMFFCNGDPVSIHTLSSASYEILSQLCSGQGVKNIIEDGTEEFIKPAKRKEVRDKIYKARNFFKHSGKDSKENIEFNPKLNDFFIWDSCRLYKLLISESTTLMTIFNSWFYLENKEIFLGTELHTKMEAIPGIREIGLYTKEQFFQEMLPLAEKLQN